MKPLIAAIILTLPSTTTLAHGGGYHMDKKAGKVHCH